MVDIDPFAQDGSILYQKPSDIRYPSSSSSTSTNQPPVSSVITRSQDLSGEQVVNLGSLLALVGEGSFIHKVDIDVIAADGDGVPVVQGSTSVLLEIEGESLTIKGNESNGALYPCSDFEATMTDGDTVRFTMEVVL